MVRIVYLALSLGLAACAVAPSGGVIKAEYVCEDGQVVSATFDNRGEPTATLRSAGRSTELPIAMSASGARYSDGETTFWLKGNEALLERGGVAVTCRTAGGEQLR